MARFFFDIHDHAGDFRDEEGLELPDMKAAEAIARRTLSGLVQDALRDSRQEEIAITIRDHGQGPVLMRVTLETRSSD